MGAKNMKELNNMIMRRLVAAMNVAAYKALGDMYEETGGYYGGGEPKMYQRTGALGDTPRTTAVTSSTSATGGIASFQAFLDKGHSYTTGKRPSMETVLELTNNGGVSGYRPTVGSKGYWERAEEKIQQSFNETMRSFF